MPPPPPPRDTSRTLAVISHLGGVAGGFILPLAIYLSEGNKNSFVRHHAREALNFQITYLIVYLVGVALFFGSFFLSVASDRSFPGFISPLPLFSLIWFGSIGFSVMGSVRASQNQWWRYPVAIRFLKDEIAG